MSGPLHLEFVTSAVGLEHLPDSDAEVALVGRSNVGKSSLLNALANRHQLANTSKTPGRTRQLNCYRSVDGGTLVDCPGYGYAKASKVERASWGAMIERYLLERQPLRMVLALVDGEIGPTPLDEALLEWLRHHGLPFVVVATKHDKVRSAQREKRKRDLAAGCGLQRREVVWVSAQSGVNVDHLRTLVRGWLTP
jgi:GTP-binding protein